VNSHANSLDSSSLFEIFPRAFQGPFRDAREITASMTGFVAKILAALLLPLPVAHVHSC
jgi:hypothetical protein